MARRRVLSHVSAMLVPRISAPARAYARSSGYLRKMASLRGAVVHPGILAARLALTGPPYPFRGVEGTDYVATSRAEAFEILYRRAHPERTVTTFELPEFSRSVTIHGFEVWDGREVFQERIYRHLPVQGRTVLDFGGSVGDAAIYFSLRGARRVISYEPDARMVELARQNLASNGISNVDLRPMAVAGDPARIPPPFRARLVEEPDTAGRLRGAQEAPRRTLDEAIDDAAEDGLSVKLDIDGPEYELLFSASPDRLARVRDVQLEYHYGARLLRAFLAGQGYGVTVGRPHYESILRHRSVQVYGDLWASRGGRVGGAN